MVEYSIKYLLITKYIKLLIINLIIIRGTNKVKIYNNLLLIPINIIST